MRRIQKILSLKNKRMKKRREKNVKKQRKSKTNESDERIVFICSFVQSNQHFEEFFFLDFFSFSICFFGLKIQRKELNALSANQFYTI